MNKTKKNLFSSKNKDSIWKIFDATITEKKSTIECIFRDTPTDNCSCCNSSLQITDEGFSACSNKMCGIVYTDNIDHTAEWRFYGAEDSHSDDPTRCGMPTNELMAESSIGCKVVCGSNSSYEMRKIQRYNEWNSMPYKEKSRLADTQYIMLLASQSGISKIIVDDAMRYHKKLSEARSFRGLNREGIIAATLYISARLNKCPRSAKEIATIFHLDTTSTTKGCKNAMAIINELELDMNVCDKTYLSDTQPVSFIERYCSKIIISSEFVQLCKFISIQISKKNLMPENTPQSIAVGIIYFVSQEFKLNIDKRSINAISDISDITITKCYKKIDTLKEQLIPQSFREKYKK